MKWRPSFKEFIEEFEISAFVEGNVPAGTAFPYATYTLGRQDFGMEFSGTIHLHYYTESEKTPSDKADEICDMIRSGFVLKCDEGAIVITTGSPEWIAVFDEDINHKHRVINYTATFLLSRGEN